MPTFLGIKASQSWNDFPIWEEFFNQNPIRTMVELGTDLGGMSTFLALQCYQRRIYFHTFDHEKFFDFSLGVPALLNLQACTHWFDIFSDSGSGAVADIIVSSPKPLAIFFDNGNKPREWSIFAPMTSPGDFCIVHDWDNEFHQEDIGDVPVERILTELSDARPPGWKSMWFRRI